MGDCFDPVRFIMTVFDPVRFMMTLFDPVKSIAKQQQLVVGAEHIWQDQTHSKEISAKLTSIRIHCYECYFHLSKMAHFVHGTHISSGQL